MLNSKSRDSFNQFQKQQQLYQQGNESKMIGSVSSDNYSRLDSAGLTPANRNNIFSNNNNNNILSGGSPHPAHIMYRKNTTQSTVFGEQEYIPATDLIKKQNTLETEPVNLDKYGKYSIQYARKKAAEEAIQRKQKQYFLDSQLSNNISKNLEKSNKNRMRLKTQETRVDTGASTLHTHGSLDISSTATLPRPGTATYLPRPPTAQTSSNFYINNNNNNHYNTNFYFPNQNNTNNNSQGHIYVQNDTQHSQTFHKSSSTIKNLRKVVAKPPIQTVLSDEVLDRLENQRKKKEDQEFAKIFTSSVDSQLPRYRFQNDKAVELERKESIQAFIFNKKSQNKLKYSDRSKINTTALPVPKGSISVMLNVAKKDYGFNLDNFKKKIPAKSKFKMKWKTIQWLLINKQDVIKQLFSNYSLMLQFAKNKKEGMNRQEFGELLSYVGLGAEENLGDKLFYIFDDDGSLTVDYKELIIGLEMFKDNSIDDKLKVFMDLCDTDKNGNVSPDELYRILKQNLFNHDDKVKLKGIIRGIFTNKENSGQQLLLDRNQLYKATSLNVQLLSLLDESVRNVKRVDQIIENDLEEPFHCWVPISANFVNYKEGIHFGLVKKLLKVVESVENSYQLRKDSRQRFKEAFVMGKTQKELEALKEDSLNDSNEEEERQ